MKLEKLVLKPFGNIVNSTIGFHQGINLITGGNGEGKSTVLKALVLLLFDYVPYGKLENYIPDNGGKYFYIEVEFTHEGKKFKQSLKYDGSSSRELWVNGDFYKGQDAVKKLAEFFDPKLSLAASVSIEGEVDFIQTKPSERRELLKKIYDLDFSKSVADLDLQMKEIEAKTSELDKKIYFHQNKKYQYQTQRTLPFSKEVRNEKDSSYLNLNLRKKNYESELANYELMLSDITSLKKKLNDQGKVIEQALFNIASYEQSKKDNFENFSIKSYSIDQKIKERKDYVPDESSLIGIREELASIKLVRLKAFDENELKDLYDKKRDSILNGVNLEKEIRDIESGKCPTCGREYESGLLEEKKTLFDNLRIAHRDIEFLIEEKESEKIAYKKAVEEQNQLKTQIEILKQKEIQEIANLENKKNKVSLEVENLEKEKASLEEIFNEKNSSMDKLIETYRANISKVQTDMDENEARLQDLTIEIPLQKPEFPVDLEQQLVSLKEEIDSYDSAVSYNEMIDKANAKLKAEEEEDSIKKQELVNNKEESIKEIELYKRGKVILQKEFPNYVLVSLTKKLEYYLNDFVSRTYDKFNLKLIDKKDNMYIVYGPNEKDAILASGFEKQLFSLAWKFSLSREQNLGLVILDEVDSQSSTENSQKLFELIGSLKDVYNQALIITHRPETQEALMNTFGAKVFEAKSGAISAIN